MSVCVCVCGGGVLSFNDALNSLNYTASNYSTITHTCRLTTGIRSEKCVVRRFRRCANDKRIDSTVQPTTHLVYTV